MPSLQRSTSGARSPWWRRLASIVGVGSMVASGMGILAPTAQATSGAITMSLTSPTVSPGSSVTSVAKMPVSSQGVISQSVTQTFDPAVAKLTGPDDVIAPADWTVRYSTVGTWTAVDGEVEFMPAPGFTGEAVVRVMATDTGGATAKSRLRVMVRPRIIDGSPSSPTRIPGDVPSSIDAGRVRTPVTCPSPLVGGEPIAWITANGVTVPITRVSYPRGGVLEPPPTNQAAGVSARHASLDSTMGTSVLTWHVRYGPGCDGALNGLLRMREGDTFTIRTKAGTTQYEISGRAEVAKGDYRPSWFGQAGPHRLSLFTCSDLRNGKFTKTTAIFAAPVSRARAA